MAASVSASREFPPVASLFLKLCFDSEGGCSICQNGGKSRMVPFTKKAYNVKSAAKHDTFANVSLVGGGHFFAMTL